MPLEPQMRRVSILALLVGSSINAFTAPCLPLGKTIGQGLRNQHRTIPSSTTARKLSMIDYEYEPSENPSQQQHFVSDFPSVYPENVPFTMRGEAVRSALRSGQCIGWALGDQEHLQQGVLQLTGPGCRTFLHSQFSQDFATTKEKNHQTAAWLTPKGRLVDTLNVAIDDDSSRAWILTSPGHDAAALFPQLDRFIFPLDEVTLTHPQIQFTFTLASVKWEDVQRVLIQDVWPRLSTAAFSPPNSPDSCITIALGEDEYVLVWPSVSLPLCAAIGCTMTFVGENAAQSGKAIWQYLISEANAQGPVALGAAEYEALRIEAGQPRFGCEISGHMEKEADVVPASPMELFLEEQVLSLDKGCYRGQEGVASILKNPRGPPRAFYQVIFEDEFNLYEQQTINDVQAKNLDNDTKVPQPGNNLYVLGSNQSINVGTLTSVAIPGSTGEPNTVALGLMRRADSILKQIQDQGLEDPRVSSLIEEDGMILPPPRDPLDGLEVIVEDSFAVGTLKCVPMRKFGPNNVKNMFVEQVPDDLMDDIHSNGPWSDDNTATFSNGQPVEVTRVPYTAVESTLDVVEDAGGQETNLSTIPETPKSATDLEDDESIAEELRKAEEEAAAAAAEAERKAEKMKLLQQRAQEALARRKAKKKSDEA